MWKHEIIWSLKRQEDIGVLDALSTSQEFFLAEADDFFDFSRKLAGEAIFENTVGEMIKLPFPATLFTSYFGQSKSKSAVLSLQRDDGIESVVFYQQAKSKDWWFVAQSFYDSVSRKPYAGFNILLEKNKEAWDIHLRSQLSLVTLACSVLSTRNTYLDGVYPEGIEKRNRKRHKSGKPLLEKYHVLKFCPGKVASKNTSGVGIGQNLGSMPVHLCRGHFMHYTPERPMFGRSGLYGRFWVQSHVRGNKKNGVVVKDYEVVHEASK